MGEDEQVGRETKPPLADDVGSGHRAAGARLLLNRGRHSYLLSATGEAHRVWPRCASACALLGWSTRRRVRSLRVSAVLLYVLRQDLVRSIGRIVERAFDVGGGSGHHGSYGITQRRERVRDAGDRGREDRVLGGGGDRRLRLDGLEGVAITHGVARR